MLELQIILCNMKASLPYWLTLCIFLFAGDLFSQELTLDNLTVEENLPAGTVVGTFQVPEGTQKLWLSGIQDVVVSNSICYLLMNSGEVLIIPNYSDVGPWSAKNPFVNVEEGSIKQLYAYGVKDIVMSSELLVVKEDGSLLGIKTSDPDTKKASGSAQQKIVQPKTIQLFESGIRSVVSNSEYILAIGEDGSLWKLHTDYVYRYFHDPESLSPLAFKGISNLASC